MTDSGTKHKLAGGQNFTEEGARDYVTKIYKANKDKMTEGDYKTIMEWLS